MLLITKYGALVYHPTMKILLKEILKTEVIWIHAEKIFWAREVQGVKDGAWNSGRDKGNARIKSLSFQSLPFSWLQLGVLQNTDAQALPGTAPCIA